MTDDWQERVRRAVMRPHAARERRLFQELNPDLPHAPILSSPPSRPRPAAVMIGIRNITQPTVIMTLRSPTMPSHAGQISLPGGTPKEQDQGMVATAIRETEEEVGIPRDAIDVVGSMGPHIGGLGYAVTPVIGIIDAGVTLTPCPREVAEAFEVPLASLVAPENHIIEERRFKGTPYDMYAVPVCDRDGRERNIWGLTAGILRTLSDLFHDDSDTKV